MTCSGRALRRSAQVRLSMDSSKAMCSVVERMKSVSKFVCIDAAMTGTLILRTENDTVSIKTFFRNLTPEFSAYSAALQLVERDRSG